MADAVMPGDDESALVVTVPEAEPLVGRLRQLHEGGGRWSTASSFPLRGG